MVRDYHRFRVTYTLILFNVIIYLLTALLSANFIDIDAKVLVVMGALYGPIVFTYDEWWRLLSAMFLHGGMTHLLMNMFSLYIVGRPVELYFEKRAYVAIYFASGLMGAIASLYMHPESVGVGASGAIFGVFGALAGFFIVHRRQLGGQGRELLQNFGVIIAINLFLGLSIPSIDMSAHIAGMIIGFAGGVVLSKKPNWVGAFIIAMVLWLGASIIYLQGLYASVL